MLAVAQLYSIGNVDNDTLTYTVYESKVQGRKDLRDTRAPPTLTPYKLGQAMATILILRHRIEFIRLLDSRVLEMRRQGS